VQFWTILRLLGDSKMKPKTSPIPIPPLPGDVAAWSQCVCGSPRLFLEAFLWVPGARMYENT